MGGVESTNRLLARTAEQVDRALASVDPVERARIVAALQWSAGWALRRTVDECRREGMSWPEIGHRLGVRQTTLFDQYSAGGPIIVARPHRSPGGRNDVWTQIWDPQGQAPLRQAATRLVQAVVTPASNRYPDRMVGALYLPVHAMAKAQTGTGGPGPLLSAVAEVLRVAADLRHHPSDPETEYAGDPSGPSGVGQEGAQAAELWQLLDELAQVYERDQELIRVAANVAETRRAEETDWFGAAGAE